MLIKVFVAALTRLVATRNTFKGRGQDFGPRRRIVVHEQGGAYFAGRAVDYVILIALLPFSLLAIPAFLSTADYAIGRDRTAMRLAAIPFIAFLFVATFSSLYLFRANSPYSLYVHECRDKGRCSPAALLQGLADTMRFRLAVDRGNDVCARNSYDDTGTVANAIDVIDRYAAKHAKVTVLLGENRSY